MTSTISMVDRFEAVIDIDSAVVAPWGLPIEDQFQWPPPWLVLFTVDVVATALGGCHVHHRGGRIYTVSVSRDGIATVYCDDAGRRFVYVLHPARWSDGEGPAIYVGVWPD